jgi:BioD-like phosphotransacetylase family protein
VEGAGKTMVAAGLAKNLLGNGRKVGFCKPVAGETSDGGDGDVLFMQQVLKADESQASACPATANGLKTACDRIAQGRDVVIVEGVCQPELIAALGARVIAIESYSKESSPAGLETYRNLGECLLGVVWNKVPAGKLESVLQDSRCGEAGIAILGALPEDRALSTLSVGELAGCLQAEILSYADKSSELVEGLMLGAMAVDPGPDYFGRKGKKAVIVKGERPDMQMAALETSLRCLVLCGGTVPSPAVRSRAEDKGVPVIMTKNDTLTAAAAVEKALADTRFNQAKKLPRLAEIMEKHFGFPEVYRGLGLAG